MFADLTDWVSDVIDAIGYVGVALLVALESVFPPIPSEVVLPLAGFVAGRGDASLVGMIVAATCGSVAGALVLYGVAAWVGPVRLRRFVARFGRWFGVSEDDLARAEAWFDRRARTAVLVGRCVPLIRSVVSVPAGLRRMPIVPFVVLTAIGSAVWNAALIGAGAALGDRWERVGDVVSVIQLAVVLAIVGLVALFVIKRFVRPMLARRTEVPSDDVVTPEAPGPDAR